MRKFSTFITPALPGFLLLAAFFWGCGSDNGRGFSDGEKDASAPRPTPTSKSSSGSTGQNPAPPPAKICTKYEYHPDEDGDGVGHYVYLEPPVVACPEDAPKGYAPTNGDCADHDPRAHYGQRQYFNTPIKGENISPSAWDFNCNGIEEKESLPSGGVWVEEAKNCGNTGKWKLGDAGAVETRTLGCQ